MNDTQRSEYFLEKLIAVPSISGDEAAVVQYLRSSRPAFLVRLDEEHAEAIAA